MFVYQGSTIELPKPFYTNTHTDIPLVKQIFGCDDGRCHTCEKCMLKDMNRPREILNNATVLNVSELKDLSHKYKLVFGCDSPVELSTRYGMIRNDGSSGELFTVLKKLGFTHGCFLNTEKAVISLVWKSVAQSRLDTENTGINREDHRSKTKDEDNNINNTTFNEKSTDTIQESEVMNTGFVSNIGTNNHAQNKTLSSPPKLSEFPNSSNPSKLISCLHRASNKVDSGRVNKVSASKKQSAPKLPTQSNNVTSPSVSESPFFCRGKVGNSSWGCGKSYKNMLALKEHWLDSDGKACLTAFIDLRKQLEGGNKAR